MKPKQVLIVDLGFDRDFTTSAAYVQSSIESLTARYGGEPVAELEFVRTRDLLTVANALRQELAVIHVLAHGMSDRNGVGFVSEDEKTFLDLDALEDYFSQEHQGICADVFFADCCKTGTARFVKELRDCLERPTLYIGSSRSVTWYESTTFSSGFYGALFRKRGRGEQPLEFGASAADKAIQAYEVITGDKCPFRYQVLEPSRAAKKNLVRSTD